MAEQQLRDWQQAKCLTCCIFAMTQFITEETGKGLAQGTRLGRGGTGEI